MSARREWRRGSGCFAPLVAAALLAAGAPVVAAFAANPANLTQPDERPELAGPAIIYVVRRGWHIDIGFAAGDLRPPLNSMVRKFPGVHYLFFGFGDRRYLLAKNRNAPVLLAALWPGPGMLLVTALGASPQDAFGSSQVAPLPVTLEQSRGAQAFVWQSLEGPVSDQGDNPIRSYAPGPYEGSLYFATPLKYSAAHTCNTWAAEALRTAGLPIRSAGVVFARQLWSQVQPLRRKPSPAAREPPAPREAPIAPSFRPGKVQLQGGFVPSWQTTVVPEF